MRSKTKSPNEIMEFAWKQLLVFPSRQIAFFKLLIIKWLQQIVRNTDKYLTKMIVNKYENVRNSNNRRRTDSMNSQIIAKRIKEAREGCHLSQQELANRMGWKSHASIVSIENGTQDIKMWELLKLADILKVSPESLYQEDSGEMTRRPVILWRDKAENFKDVFNEEQVVNQHYQDFLLVGKLVDLPTPCKALPKEACDIACIDTDWANKLADKVYREFRLGDYPADSLARYLEEEFGVFLLSRPLSNGSAACSRDESGAIIVLNEKEAPWRQPFSLAHELFHLITWNPSLIEKIGSDKNLFKKNEKLADAFAAALLMPHQMISQDIQGNKITYSLIVALAMKYHVSRQAMLWRLLYLRFINREAVDKALKDKEFKELNHATFKQAFGSFCPLGNRFLRLAYLAFEKGRLSKARLAQMLTVKLRDLDQYLLEKGLCLTNDKEIETHYC
jgi:Zn-dependent peptidase ImmA (M78 family)